MCNEDGTIRIVFNGEMYNHLEHRARLESKGYKYRSRADTETVLHLYEECGEDCVKHLRGMFALAIWDEPKKRLFLARDRLGIKPLYYALSGGTFLFASEIKALLRYPGIAAELDEEGLFHYLTFMIPPAPMTLFRGIHKLPPACRMTVTESGPGEPEIYWDPAGAAAAPGSEAECRERVLGLLEESVRLRMMSDVPFGAFLSGGIDSSAIVALMAKNSNLPINTFTVGYKDAPHLNELDYARRVAKEFGANHREVMIGSREMVDYMPKLVHTQDEPIGDPVCVPLYYVSKLAKDNGVTVIQVGEGSDELFCGYPWYLPYIREMRMCRSPLAKIARSLSALLLPGAKGVRALTGRGHLWVDRLGAWRKGETPFWGGAVVFRGEAKETLLDTPRWQSTRWNSAEMPERNYGRFLELRPGGDVLEQMIYLELKHRLPELLLMRVDKISMSTSLEGRVPFLDHLLVEYALAIPMKWKVKGQPKYILKKALEGVIPEEIIYRKKQGFPAPVKEWFRGISAQRLASVILEGQLMREGYFNKAYVKGMLDQQLAGRADWSTRLWILFNLSLWHAHWIDGAPIQ